MSMATRPTADELVDAVRNAGANLAALDDRIDELERDLIAARMAADNASSDLAEARRALEVSGLALQDEAKRRDRAENTAAYHVRRTGNLQSELARDRGHRWRPWPRGARIARSRTDARQHPPADPYRPCNLGAQSMKITILAASGLLIMTVGSFAQGYGANPSDHYVNGYTTNRGTEVQGHYQTNPNSTTHDNYGASGNYNPHTGAYGTRN